MFKQSLLIALIFLSFAWFQCSKNPVKEKYLEPPFNLVADSGLEGRVYLAWQAPMAGGETGYRLYRKKSGENYSSIATIEKMPDPEYTDTTVTDDIIYYYVVTALYSQGESEYSNKDWALPGKNQPPWIENISIDPQTLLYSEGDSVVYIQVWIDDNQGSDDVDSVVFLSIRPGGIYENDSFTFRLYNDGDVNGLSGDKIKGDKVFSLKRLFSKSDPPFEGTYTLIFTAYDRSGASSTPDTANFNVSQLSNEPPEIINITILPDTLSLSHPEDSTSYIEVEVDDPQGYGDVDSVRFWSTKPDGTPGHGGKPIPLYNDGGASGDDGNVDEVAGDEIFTVVIKFSPTFPPDIGRYIFVLRARDRHGLESPPDTVYFYIIE